MALQCVLDFLLNIALESARLQSDAIVDADDAAHVLYILQDAGALVLPLDFAAGRHDPVLHVCLKVMIWDRDIPFQNVGNSLCEAFVGGAIFSF